MKIIWTENAKNDLNKYKQNSKIIIDTKIEEYISSLIDYVDNLTNYHELGKFLFYKKDFEIRQLIYHMHRIYYAIHTNTIYVLVISHTKRNTYEAIKTINNFFN